MSRNYKSLAAFIIAILGGGMLIGVSTLPGAWYQGLTKPWFNPPNWVFGPAWTTLYIMIAIAGWMLWEKHRQSNAMKIWVVAVALNFLWSPAFFGMQNIGLALIIVIAMLISIFAFIISAGKLDRRIALLFVPYGLWVTFASLLNASIYQLN
jgi:tryptophan-rich sensory protein